MDALAAIFSRRSVRRYRSDPVLEEDLAQILEAGRQAPSAANRQPWHFIVVRDADTRRAVAEACKNQMFMADAAVIICACTRPEVSERWHRVDTAIALENMVLAATALGYGTCWIGAMEEQQVKAVLAIPAELTVLCLTPVGVPDEQPAARDRKPHSEITSRDRYGTPWE